MKQSRIDNKPTRRYLHFANHILFPGLEFIDSDGDYVADIYCDEELQVCGNIWITNGVITIKDLSGIFHPINSELKIFATPICKKQDITILANNARVLYVNIGENEEAITMPSIRCPNCKSAGGVYYTGVAIRCGLCVSTILS